MSKIFRKGEKVAYAGHGVAEMSYGDVVNPTAEMLKADGWKADGEGICAKDYAALVEELVRKRYTVSDELAILRQRDDKPEDFAEYNAFVEECKKQAKEQL